MATQHQQRARSTLIHTLIWIAVSALHGGGRPVELCRPATLVARVRRSFIRAGYPIAPVGVGNAKTRVASTYRPIGETGSGTCPTGCPYLDSGCYGRGGNCNLHQRRAETYPLVAYIASTIAAIAVARSAGLAARLHVTGDLCREGRLDREYLESLVEIGHQWPRRMSTDRALAFTYTHLSDPGEARYAIDRLRAAGIVCLWSDRIMVGGAIVVADRVEARMLAREHRATCRIVLCAAQSHGVSCAECRLCERAPALGLCMAFLPEGAAKRRAAEASPARR